MEAPDPLLSTKTPGVTHDQQICQTRGWYLSGVLLTMTLTSSRLTMGPAAPVPSETWMAIASLSNSGSQLKEFKGRIVEESTGYSWSYVKETSILEHASDCIHKVIRGSLWDLLEIHYSCWCVKRNKQIIHWDQTAIKGSSWGKGILSFVKGALVMQDY